MAKNLVKYFIARNVRFFSILLILLLISGNAWALNLDVPFLPQVPPGNWTETRNCGQTSAIMVFAYHNGQTPEAQDIRDVDDWLFTRFGDSIRNYNGDYTDVDKLTTLAQEYGGFPDSEFHRQWSIDDLRGELENGNPVIVAVRLYMSTDKLGHFMVLRGIDDNYVYVNDPGRSVASGQGENKRYTQTQFLESWNTQNRACVTIHSNCGYSAQYHNQAPYPDPVTPGETYQWWIEFKNTGDETWYRGAVNLGAGAFSAPDTLYDIVDSSWLDDYRATTMDQQSAAPGEIARFTFTFTVPFGTESGRSQNYNFTPVAEAQCWMRNPDGSHINAFMKYNVAPESSDDTAWNGNGSVISYHGRLLSDGAGVDWPFGITQDVVQLHASDKKPAGFFQWQINTNGCNRLELKTTADGKRANITIGPWQERSFDRTFTNVAFPFVIGPENTDLAMSEHTWYVVKVVFNEPLNQDELLYAFCTDKTPTSASYMLVETAETLDDGYQWNGNASVIAHMFRNKRDYVSYDPDDWPYGAFNDVVNVHPSREKPMVFFQWQRDDICPRLKLDAPDLDDSEKWVDIHIKAWKHGQGRIFRNQKLPVVLDSSDTYNGSWDVIQIKFLKPVSDFSRVEAECVQNDSNKNPLSVPYLDQLDIPNIGEAACASASSAMILAYYGKVANTQQAMINAAETVFSATSSTSYGLLGRDKLAAHLTDVWGFSSVHFDSSYWDVLYETIKNEINNGRPMILGSRTMTSYGHYIVVIGYEGDDYETAKLIVNDPYGHWYGVDNYNSDQTGKGLKYDFKNITMKSSDGVFVIIP